MNIERIVALNSNTQPLYDPSLDEAVASAIGRNRHSSTDIQRAIAATDLIFVSVSTPTKSNSLGARRAKCLRNNVSVSRLIVDVSEIHKFVVEKSTIPIKSATTIKSILGSISSYFLIF